MLEYDRIDISEGIDINKCEETSRKCSYVSSIIYDMSLKAVSIQNLTIINHNGNYYRVIFAFMTKKDAHSLIKNAMILGEKGTL